MYKVLFVDDDDTIGFIVSKMKVWENSNFKITRYAQNGKEALLVLEKESFDLIITDIRMPIVDGLELLENIRKRGDKTFLVLASTYSEFEYAKRGLQNGAIDYIIKPITEENLKELFIRVEKLLKEKEDKPKETNLKVSKDRIDKWYNLFINLEETPKNLKDKYLKELNDIVKEEKVVFSELLFEGVWEKIVKVFPWLVKLENIEFLFKEESFEKEVEEKISNIKEIVKKYKLNNYDSLINNVSEVILKNIGKDKLLDIISKELQLSKDYIGKLFKNKIGITLNEYSTILKMEYGKKLLSGSNKKVYEISEELGYSTIDYFSKLFKNYTGFTPVQYRKKALV
ncbi:MAG: response regulator [Clostridium sp.]|jgi:two-component system response regulator YesN